MRHGIDLVPTFSFNEQFIYRQLVSDTGKVPVSYNEPLHSSTRYENILEIVIAKNNNFLFVGSLTKKVQDLIEKTLGFIPVLFFGRGMFNYT